jgi:cytochrome oxidase assembly protein ShyY1
VQDVTNDFYAGAYNYFLRALGRWQVHHARHSATVLARLRSNAKSNALPHGEGCEQDTGKGTLSGWDAVVVEL